MENLEIFAESLKKAFIAIGIDLPDKKIKEIAEKNLEEAGEFLLFQKYGRPAVKIAPRQLPSFEEIVKIGGFNNGYYAHLEKNETCRKAIFAPITSTGDEELVVYWENENQNIPGGADIYDYFKSKGFEVIEKAHPSLLVNAMNQLTEEKLTEMGIPPYVNIVLPTSEGSLLPLEGGYLCFLRASRDGGERRLSLVRFDGGWNDYCAFLLRKM